MSNEWRRNSRNNDKRLVPSEYGAIVRWIGSRILETFLGQGKSSSSGAKSATSVMLACSASADMCPIKKTLRVMGAATTIQILIGRDRIQGSLNIKLYSLRNLRHHSSRGQVR